MLPVQPLIPFNSISPYASSAYHVINYQHTSPMATNFTVAAVDKKNVLMRMDDSGRFSTFNSKGEPTFVISENNNCIPMYPILAPSGTVEAPAYSFINSPNSGVFMHSTNRMHLVVGGANILQMQRFRRNEDVIFSKAHIVPVYDNIYDIGTGSSNFKFRSVHLSRSVILYPPNASTIVNPDTTNSGIVPAPSPKVFGELGNDGQNLTFQHRGPLMIGGVIAHNTKTVSLTENNRWDLLVPPATFLDPLYFTLEHTMRIFIAGVVHAPLPMTESDLPLPKERHVLWNFRFMLDDDGIQLTSAGVQKSIVFQATGMAGFTATLFISIRGDTLVIDGGYQRTGTLFVSDTDLVHEQVSLEEFHALHKATITPKRIRLEILVATVDARADIHTCIVEHLY